MVQPPMPRGTDKPPSAVTRFETKNGSFEAGPGDVLGRGTYGVVYRARKVGDPTVTKAIKTFAPETIDDREGIPSTTLREISALKTTLHPNVMAVHEVVTPHNSVRDMFVVMELCRGTLKDKVVDMIGKFLHHDVKWLQPQRMKQPQLPVAYMHEAKIVVWQMLNALCACHSRGVMHRDIKPANVLWSFDDLMKLGDFGLARFLRGHDLYSDSTIPLTGEVQTLWYRAPEILLGEDRYSLLIDVWSVGCIMGEMFRFAANKHLQRLEPHPLFVSKGDLHAVLLIFETLGTPVHDIDVKKLPYWSDEFPVWPAGKLSSRVPYLDADGLDLLSKLLKLNPKERVCSRYLLRHHWFNDVRAAIRSRFVPWYQGREELFMRQFESMRMPPAQLMNRTPKDTVGKTSATATAGGGAAVGAAVSSSGAVANVDQAATRNAAGNEGAQHGAVTGKQHDDATGKPNAAQFDGKENRCTDGNAKPTANNSTATGQKENALPVGRVRKTSRGAVQPGADGGGRGNSRQQLLMQEGTGSSGVSSAASHNGIAVDDEEQRGPSGDDNRSAQGGAAYGTQDCNAGRAQGISAVDARAVRRRVRSVSTHSTTNDKKNTSVAVDDCSGGLLGEVGHRGQHKVLLDGKCVSGGDSSTRVDEDGDVEMRGASSNRGAHLDMHITTVQSDDCAINSTTSNNAVLPANNGTCPNGGVYKFESMRSTTSDNFTDDALVLLKQQKMSTGIATGTNTVSNNSLAGSSITQGSDVITCTGDVASTVTDRLPKFDFKTSNDTAIAKQRSRRANDTSSGAAQQGSTAAATTAAAAVEYGAFGGEGQPVDSSRHPALQPSKLPLSEESICDDGRHRRPSRSRSPNRGAVPALTSSKRARLLRQSRTGKTAKGGRGETVDGYAVCGTDRSDGDRHTAYGDGQTEEVRRRLNKDVPLNVDNAHNGDKLGQTSAEPNGMTGAGTKFVFGTSSLLNRTGTVPSFPACSGGGTKGMEQDGRITRFGDHEETTNNTTGFNALRSTGASATSTAAAAVEAERVRRRHQQSGVATRSRTRSSGGAAQVTRRSKVGGAALQCAAAPHSTAAVGAGKTAAVTAGGTSKPNSVLTDFFRATANPGTTIEASQVSRAAASGTTSMLQAARSRRAAKLAAGGRTRTGSGRVAATQTKQ